VPYSEFSRKNYFYPDLPKNYQISQYDLPLCINGSIDLEGEGVASTVGITRVHMEEDTGKSVHMGDGGRIQEAEHSLLDFNRAGVPLVEVVTEPDLRSAAEARVYGAELQRIVRALGVSDARLEEGSMRFDANVSVRKIGDDTLGTRAEVKNVNSLRSLQRAIEFEIERQIVRLESGQVVIQETRHWNEDRGVTSAMRSKEESEDYRYFQEPDLVPLEVDDARRAEILASLPELPAAHRARLTAAGLDERTASLVAADFELAALFDAASADGADPRTVGNWLTGEVVAYLRREDTSLPATALESRHLVDLSAMVADNSVSATAAKDVLEGVMAGEGSPSQVAEARDLLQISDAGVIEEPVAAVMAEHADAVEKIRGGDMKPIGFLVGQVMRATGGKADPAMVQALIRERAGG
jgi:aspartyl-tRNA(Asn)/glutamyl-tRNA(Gln) amidotransferase subunit B